jgi:hypothetical protein
MKVKLKSQYVGTSWFTEDKVYPVIEVYIDLNNSVTKLRIFSDEKTPILKEFKFFDVVDSHLNPDWVFKQSESFIELSFKEILKEGFWDDYFDGKPDAVKTFNKIMYELAST